MFVLISYDVAVTSEGGQSRLRRVAKLCENYGQRVQYSVFELIVDSAKWVSIKHKLVNEIDQETDSLRFYYLGSNWRRKVEHVGAKKAIDQEGPLII
jgi:CRISPR-associated protein Cas2